MTKPLKLLADEGVISLEVLKKLKDAWISTADELYSRIQACKFSEKDSSRNSIARELGIETESLEKFKRQLERYVSPEVLKAEKPREYPLGYNK